MSDLQMILELPPGYKPIDWHIFTHGFNTTLIRGPKGVFRMVFRTNGHGPECIIEPLSPLMSLSLWASLNIDFPWMTVTRLVDLSHEEQVGILQGVARCIEAIKGAQ